MQLTSTLISLLVTLTVYNLLGEAVKISTVYNWVCQGKSIPRNICKTNITTVMKIKSVSVLTSTNMTSILAESMECTKDYKCLRTILRADDEDVPPEYRYLYRWIAHKCEGREHCRGDNLRLPQWWQLTDEFTECGQKQKRYFSAALIHFECRTLEDISTVEAPPSTTELTTQTSTTSTPTTTTVPATVTTTTTTKTTIKTTQTATNSITSTTSVRSTTMVKDTTSSATIVAATTSQGIPTKSPTHSTITATNAVTTRNGLFTSTATQPSTTTNTTNTAPITDDINKITADGLTTTADELTTTADATTTTADAKTTIADDTTTIADDTTTIADATTAKTNPTTLSAVTNITAATTVTMDTTSKETTNGTPITTGATRTTTVTIANTTADITNATITSTVTDDTTSAANTNNITTASTSTGLTTRENAASVDINQPALSMSETVVLGVTLGLALVVLITLSTTAFCYRRYRKWRLAHKKARDARVRIANRQHVIEQAIGAQGADMDSLPRHEVMKPDEFMIDHNERFVG